MPVGINPTLANTWLEATLENGSPATLQIAASWIQLHTGDPGAAGTANIAGNATRKQISWGAAAGGVKSNDVAISWTSGEVDTEEDYTFFSIHSAETDGTFVRSGTMTANAVATNDTFTIPIGDLDAVTVVAAD